MQHPIPGIKSEVLQRSTDNPRARASPQALATAVAEADKRANADAAAETVRLCCAQPRGGRARLAEGCSFHRKGDSWFYLRLGLWETAGVPGVVHESFYHNEVQQPQSEPHQFDKGLGEVIGTRYSKGAPRKSAKIAKAGVKAQIASSSGTRSSNTCKRNGIQQQPSQMEKGAAHEKAGQGASTGKDVLH
ncbi:hypothetical protein Tco_1370983 [Tanacetum coccineum]